jgi:hypothetical protein
MTYSILLIVEKPDLSYAENEKSWERFVNKIKSLAIQNTEIELLTESVLLIPLDKDLSALATAVLAIGKFQYSYLILNEETKLRQVLSRV